MVNVNVNVNLKTCLNILIILVIIGLILHNVGVPMKFGNPFDRRTSDIPVGAFMEKMENRNETENENENEKEELKQYVEKLVNCESGESDENGISGVRCVSSDLNGDGKRKVMNVEPMDNVENFVSGLGNGRGTFPQMQVKPNNFYTLNDNSSNFSSNVMDINKFYNNSFGDIEFATPYTGNAGNGQGSAKQIMDGNYLDKVGGGVSYVNKKNCDGTATFKPDMWQYKNEVVMNGGDLYDGVSGYDGMDGGLALFSNGANSGTDAAVCSGGDMSGCDMANDDLRMGMGIPGREQRTTL